MCNRPEEKKKKKKKEVKVKLSFAMDDEEEDSVDSRASSRGPPNKSLDIADEEAEGTSSLSFSIIALTDPLHV